MTLSRDIVRIVDQPRNSRVLNTCPSVSIDIPNANGANLGVDMSCVAADPYRFWFNPPVRISNNSTGVGADRAVAAEAGVARAQARGGSARGAERDPLNDALEWRLADAAEGFPAVADGVLWFRRFVRLMVFETIHDIALMLDRERLGHEASPSGGVFDSQTVKAPAPGAKRGYDAAKKTVSRKRHVAVDTDGRLLMINLTPADISDSAGAQLILDAIRKRGRGSSTCDS